MKSLQNTFHIQRSRYFPVWTQTVKDGFSIITHRSENTTLSTFVQHLLPLLLIRAPKKEVASGLYFQPQAKMHRMILLQSSVTLNSCGRFINYSFITGEKKSWPKKLSEMKIYPLTSTSKLKIKLFSRKCTFWDNRADVTKNDCIISKTTDVLSDKWQTFKMLRGNCWGVLLGNDPHTQASRLPPCNSELYWRTEQLS